jgi:hypothetical protein
MSGDRRQVSAPLFQSFFLGGFECSCHRRPDGRQLDLLQTTAHGHLAAADYAMLQEHGIRAARDGLRWHLIEKTPGRYDWSSFLPMLRAADAAGTQVIWDLCHYGWPDDLDIWSPAFPERLAKFAAAAARLIRDETGLPPLVCPMNEISFWAWAGGDTGRFGPCATGRGMDLKRQLVRGAIAATAAVRAADPEARFISAEPVIHIDAGAVTDPDHVHWARHFRQAQFEALDLLSGRLEPELGGSPDYLDIVGVNFYPDNQWYHAGPPIPFGHHAYQPLSGLLAEWAERYGRPLLIAETGAEGSARAAWFHYVCTEVAIARAAGTVIEGVCLYPILEYPGWVDERHCATGLLTMADADGRRGVYAALADELRRQHMLLEVHENRSTSGVADLMVAAE